MDATGRDGDSRYTGGRPGDYKFCPGANHSFGSSAGYGLGAGPFTFAGAGSGHDPRKTGMVAPYSN